MSPPVVAFSVNELPVEVEASVELSLLDVLRDDLGLTGTKEGCSIGVCGLCTVLVDGLPASACLLPAPLVAGRSVTTIEGLARDGELSALQESFITHGAFQCGICTPGQIVAATSLLEHNPVPDRDQIEGWMLGNLCRCTGYTSIVEAIEAVAGQPS